MNQSQNSKYFKIQIIPKIQYYLQIKLEQNIFNKIKNNNFYKHAPS